VLVVPASTQELHGAPLVLARLRGTQEARRFARLRVIWADRAYFSANLIAWCKQTLDVALQIVQRPAGQKGFTRLPRRWVVERTFAWLGRSRRLGRDHEQTPASSEAFIYLAMTRLMVQRLAA
jgi:putative transposase